MLEDENEQMDVNGWSAFNFTGWRGIALALL